MKNLKQILINAGKGLAPLAFAGLVGCVSQPAIPSITDYSDSVPKQSDNQVPDEKDLVNLGNGYYATSYIVKDMLAEATSAALGEVILKKTGKGFGYEEAFIMGRVGSDEKWNNGFTISCKNAAYGSKIIDETGARELLDIVYEMQQQKFNQVEWDNGSE